MDPNDREIEDDLDTGVAGNEEDDLDQGNDLDDANLDDADDSDGEGGHDLDPADTSGEEQREPQVERTLTRSQRRVESALADAKAAREDAAQTRRELNDLRNGQNSEVESERERQALANMDPYERLEYSSRKALAATEAKLAGIEFRMADSADRTDFTSKASRSAALASVADEVEAALLTMRANNTTAPRETVAAYLLGQRAIARGAAAKTRAGKAGAARIDRASGKPTGARSDVRAEAPRNDSKEARFQRIKDMSI